MAASSEVITWLLEENNPPVRYLALTELLRRPPRNPEVRRAKAQIMEYGPTQRILEHGSEFWAAPRDHAYRKYTGLYWQVIFLGQFLADGRDRRITEGVKDMLARRDWVMSAGGQCLTANLLGAFMQLGFDEDAVVRSEAEALARRVLADDGLKCSAMAYSLLSRCYMAQSKLLLCFSRIPVERRSSDVKAAIDLLVRKLLDCEVFVYVPGRLKEWHELLAAQPKKGDLPRGKTVLSWLVEHRDAFLREHGLGPRRPKAGWHKFGFPLHYNSDTLEAMYALARLGIPMHPRLEKPLELVRSKMTPAGTWMLETSLNGKMIADVEKKGGPSKWLTFFGHYVLDHFAQKSRAGRGPWPLPHPVARAPGTCPS